MSATPLRPGMRAFELPDCLIVKIEIVHGDRVFVAQNSREAHWTFCDNLCPIDEWHVSALAEANRSLGRLVHQPNAGGV